MNQTLPVGATEPSSDRPSRGPESLVTYSDGSEYPSSHSGGSAGLPAPLELWIPSPAGWINANDRMHWRPKAKLTKAWRMAAHVYARQAKLPKGLERVGITAYVVKANGVAYDAHNLMPTGKAIMDGLVDYGLVVDDTNAHVVGPDMREGGNGLPGIRVVITYLVIDTYSVPA